MKVITMDCRGCVPRSNLHRVFADALAFPDYYGNNLNALYDCLSERTGKPVNLVLLSAGAGETADALRKIVHVVEDLGGDTKIV